MRPDQTEKPKFATLLNRLAGAPLFNSLQQAVVTETSPEKISLSVLVSGGAPFSVNAPTIEFRDLPNVGDTLTVYVEDPKDGLASRSKAVELAMLQAVERALEDQKPIQGQVIGPIHGGFAVELFTDLAKDSQTDGLRAFLPGGLASLGRDVSNTATLWADQFVVKEYNARTGSIIVSRREILQVERKAQSVEFWQQANVGDDVEGVIRTVLPYGALIESYGTTGLLHVTDMAWDRQPRPSELFKAGQYLTVKIIELDREAKKVKFGLKQLVPDPWTTLEQSFAVGSDVQGTIVALADFGAFVHVADGIEGLIHLSELTWSRVRHPSQKFQIGDTVTARVLHVDRESRRISLSTKALEKNPIESMEESFPKGSVVTARIVGMREFGLFVELGKNVVGLVHIGELSWTKKIENPADAFQIGQEIQVVVMDYDIDRQRVSCSIKRITEDPWHGWKKKYARGSRHTVTVKRITSHGAECELEPELIGFCPAKELSSEAVDRTKDAVKTGQQIEVEVLNIDPADMHVTLSVRARTLHETREDYQQYLQKQKEQGGGSRVTLGDAIGSNKE